MRFPARLAVFCLAVVLAGCRMVPYSEYERLRDIEYDANVSVRRERALAMEAERLREERDEALQTVAALRETLEDARKEWARTLARLEEEASREKACRKEILGASVEGRPLELHVFEGEGRPVLILGAIHGDEPAGALLCDMLVAHLRASPPKRRTLVLPRPNPDGKERNTRWNARGVDLNRNFPADNFQSTRRGGQSPLCEPESRAIHDLILAERPGVVVSFHQPLALMDYDGPGAEEYARRLAEGMGLPVRQLGTRPGSMGAWVGEDMGIPIITPELPRHAERGGKEAVWEAYGPAVLETFFPETVDGSP